MKLIPTGVNLFYMSRMDILSCFVIITYFVGLTYSLDHPHVRKKGKKKKNNLDIPYFFAYKTVFYFPSNTIPKNLDPSHKMDLDLWDCLGRVKLVLQKNCIGLI